MHISDLEYIEIATETEVKGGFFENNPLFNWSPEKNGSLRLDEDMLKKYGYEGYKLVSATS
jgi:hypothetical protein